MIFGIFLKSLNAFYFRDAVMFCFEFIPELIFMCSLFGYMIYTIFLKWVVDWTEEGITPPSLIGNMINMALNFGAIGDEAPLWGNKEEQESLQAKLLFFAFITIPWMLFPKPIIKILTLKK